MNDASDIAVERALAELMERPAIGAPEIDELVRLVLGAPEASIERVLRVFLVACREAPPELDASWRCLEAAEERTRMSFAPRCHACDTRAVWRGTQWTCPLDGSSFGCI